MTYRLVLNLQHFASDDIDWDAFDKEFEENFTEEPEQEVPAETEDEAGQGEPDSETNPKPESEGDPTSEPSVENPEAEKPKEKPGPDEAFKRMRQELEQSKKFESVIKEIAERNGVTPEQLLDAYEQRKLEEQAKAQNTSPEVLKRLQQLEQQNQQLTQQQFAKQFNEQVEQTVKKYDLKQEDITDTLAKAKEQGFTLQDFQRIPFETIYKTVNADILIEKKIEEARQKALEKEREIQRTSTVPTSAGDAPAVDSEDEIAKMVLADLKESGDID